MKTSWQVFVERRDKWNENTEKVLLPCAKHSTGSIVIHTIYVALPNMIDSVIAMESVPGLCNRKKKANL